MKRRSARLARLCAHRVATLRCSALGLMALSMLVTGGPVAQTATATSAQANEAEYRLGAGDRIRVIVFGHDDLSGEFVVDSAGRLSLPLIRFVDSAGLTLQELEAAITNKLKPDYLKNPRVSVEVLNYRPFYILGEVKNPGSYPYVAGLTVVEAVALAGGYTYRAKKKEILITRAQDPQRKKELAAPDTIILPGDLIEVPERFF